MIFNFDKKNKKKTHPLPNKLGSSFEITEFQFMYKRAIPVFHDLRSYQENAPVDHMPI